MNKILLIGRIVKDLEIKHLNDKKCLRNTIAVQRNFKNKEGIYESDFFNFIVWGNQAEYMKNYCKKGDKIAITGRLLNDNYEKNGEKIYTNNIHVETIEILWSNTNNEKQTKEEVVEFLD